MVNVWKWPVVTKKETAREGYWVFFYTAKEKQKKCASVFALGINTGQLSRVPSLKVSTLACLPTSMLLDLHGTLAKGLRSEGSLYPLLVRRGGENGISSSSYCWDLIREESVIFGSVGTIKCVSSRIIVYTIVLSIEYCFLKLLVHIWSKTLLYVALDNQLL